MIVLVTYHPAAVLHARSDKSSSAGLSKEAIIRSIREDLLRAREYIYSKDILTAIGTSTEGTEAVKSLPVKSFTLPNPVRGSGTQVPKGIGTLGIDTEYSPRKELLTAAFSDGTTMWSWDKDLGGVEPLQLTNHVHTLIGQNLPEDIALLWERGHIPRRAEWLKGKNLHDSLLMGRMNYEGLASYKLEDLLASLFTVERWKFKTEKENVLQWTPEERVERCERDAWAPTHIVRQLYPLLSANDTADRPTHTQQSLYPFTMATAMTLHRLTLAGAFVDRAKFEKLVEAKEDERRQHFALLSHAANLLGVPDYEPTNDNQTRKLLYEKLDLPVLALTKKTHEPQVTKPVIEMLTEQTEGGVKLFLETLLAYNKADKIITTYLVGDDESKESNAIQRLGVPINGTSCSGFWLPFHFHVLGAKTARRSSSRPNSQNWPKAIRQLVRSRWPGGKILAADYRKLEPVIIAWLAGDEKLLQFFTTGGGYIDVARELFRTDVKEGTVLYRGVKSIVLGVHYDMGTEEMAHQLWVVYKIRFSDDYNAHWQETDRIRKLYLERFPRIPAYMERRRREARETGAVRTPVGRLRRVGKEYVDKHILNQAINAPVQGTASDVTASALVDVEAAILREYGLSLVEWYDHLITQRRIYLTSDPSCGIIPEQWRVPTLFNEVHDELTTDLPPDTWKKDLELVVETMRAVPTVRSLAPYLKNMPLYVDPKVSDYWGE